MRPDEALTALRREVPLVHNITNYVAMNFAANVLLAAGASPAMLHAEEEVADVAAVAGALTINIGTLSAPWLAGMKTAARAATDAGVPWVLDPVAHYASPWRGQAAADLVALGPSVIRGNASEILALAGAEATGKGPDAGDDVEDAEGPAADLAARTGAVIVVTGARDLVVDGARRARVDGGTPLMGRVTTMGCALTGLIGGYAAVAPAFDAAVAALAHYAAAGDAAAGVEGPGSFVPAFLDALYVTRPADLPAHVS